MTNLSAILLGLVQGLTEFLPVSSSGHLVIAQSLIPGFSQPGVLFDVILHFGTLFSVLYFFRGKIFKISFRYLLLLFIGTIPAVLAGFLFRDQLELMFKATKWVGLELIISGFLNLYVDKAKSKKSEVSVKDSVWVGVFQAIAIIPGISRSGATIFAGVKRGVNKEKVAEFSFLLSVPAILGANLLEIVSYSGKINGSFSPYIAGFLAALISGYVAIKIVYSFLAQNKFKYFAYYCFLVGVLAVVFFR